MAVPRVFVSSTCYDLQEIRLQLRAFIKSMGYEPVMSEFGDIFYDLEKHVHDSCSDEVARSNMFILIIGNSYGSLYYEQMSSPGIPDSITLKEFRKALEVGVPKFIFTNRFVKHDYDNYRRALSKRYSEEFAKKKVADNKVTETKQKIRKGFDKTYPFPQEPYQYVFHFLDIIDSLKSNNAVITFEGFDDIKEILKKQWAGLVFDSLNRDKRIPIAVVEQFAKKLDTIEKQIRTIVDSKTNESSDKTVVTFSLGQLSDDILKADFQEMKEKVETLLYDIRFEDHPFDDGQRVTFKNVWDQKTAKDWLDSLRLLVEKFKWSTTISVHDLYSDYDGGYKFWKTRLDIPFETIFQLSRITEGLSEEDRKTLANAVALKMNECYEKEPIPPPPPPPMDDDDVPF